MYSADENKDNNSIPDADRKRYPSKPQSDTTDSMVDMIMGARTGPSANSAEAQQITVDAENTRSANSRQNVESAKKTLSV